MLMKLIDQAFNDVSKAHFTRFLICTVLFVIGWNVIDSAASFLGLGAIALKAVLGFMEVTAFIGAFLEVVIRLKERNLKQQESHRRDA